MTRAIDTGGRQGRDWPESLEATQEVGRSILVSPWVWFGGVCSLCVWAVLIKVFA